jgi:hypothetical protein
MHKTTLNVVITSREFTVKGDFFLYIIVISNKSNPSFHLCTVKWYKYSLNIAPKTVGKYLKGKCGKPQFGSLKEYDLFPESQNQL